MKSPRNILICTLSGVKNLGDELILASEIWYFRSRYPEAIISVATFHPESTQSALNTICRSCRSLSKFVEENPYQNVKYIQYFPYSLWKYPFKNMYFLLRQLIAFFRHDLVVIGWGGIFFDNEKNSFYKIFLEWIIRLLPTRICRRKCIFLWISLEMTQSKNIKLLKYIIRPQDDILVRDHSSKEHLYSIGRTALCIPDMAFGHMPQIFSKKTTIRHIGFALRWWFLDADEQKMLREIVIDLQKRWYKISFLSHSLCGDEEHHDEIFVWSIFWDQFQIAHTLDETIELYSEIDLLVGMRFHSILLWAQYAIPVLALSYGSKTDSLIHELDIDASSMRIGSWDQKDFFDRFDYIQSHYSEIQEWILKKYTEIHHNLLQKLNNPDTMREEDYGFFKNYK